MAFANLFTKLPVFGENVKSPVQPPLTDRKETGNVSSRRGKKRKNKGKQTGSYEKKPRYQIQTTRTDGSTSFHKTDHDNVFHKGQNTKTKNEWNVNQKQCQEKRWEQQKHRQGDGRRPAHIGGRLAHRGERPAHRGGSPADRDGSPAHRGGRLAHRGGRPAHRGGSPADRDGSPAHRGGRLAHRGGRPADRGRRPADRGRRPADRGGRPADGDGRPRRTGEEDRKYRNKDTKVERTRFMTQEFKDQNAFSDGDRLICKHFLWGKCVKGDECQLEHVEGYNGLVKEPCKYYIQGTCIKGESCPYMHKSFPCKFFHRRAKCNQGENCRFSHEPLDELKNKLLDEALQRENELIELSKKAEQESSEQPVNSGQSENTEATKTPEVLLQPLRPNFYQCVEIKAEEKAPSPQTQELTESSEEAETPHEAPSANLDQKEPVCYSVDAVLGPQLSKPLLSFFTAPRNQEPAPLHSSDSLPASASNTNHAPYSVEAVLRSFKSAETPPSQPTQTVAYSQKSALKGSSDPSSETWNEKSRYSAEGNKFQKLFQSLPSLQTPSNLTPNSCSDLNLPSGELGRRVGNMQESLKPDVRFEPSDIRESRNLHSDIKHCKGDGADHVEAHHHTTFPSNSPTQTSFSSERPVPSKPHLSVMTPILRTSFKPFTPSPDPSKFKGKHTLPAVLISNPVKVNNSADFVSYSTTKQSTNGDLLPKDTGCSSETADCHLTSGCKLKTSFQSLFSKPLTDSPQRKVASTTSFCPQGLNQSSPPALKSAGLKTNSLKASVQPDKPPARSFVSLFAAPLPGLQPQGDHSRTSSALQKTDLKAEAPPRFSDPEQRAANSQTQSQEKAEEWTPLGGEDVCPLPASAHFPPDPEKVQKGASAECTDQTTDEACSPVSGSPCEGSLPGVIAETTTQISHSVPEISSCKAEAEEAAGRSILKTLFQRLSPYKHDGEQQSPDQKIQKEADVSTGPVFENQQPTRKKGRQKK